MRENGEEFCATDQQEELSEQGSEGGEGEPTESITEEQKEDDSLQFSDALSGPVYVRRNPPRDKHQPKRLTYQLRAMESAQQKIERGRKIWQRARRNLSPVQHSHPLRH